MSTIPCLTPTCALSPSHTCPWPPCGSLPSTTCFCTLTHPYPVTRLPNGFAIFELNLSCMIAQHFSNLVHSTHNYLPMKMEETDCSKTSAYKLPTPGNYPEESIQHSEHSESLKSRIQRCCSINFFAFPLQGKNQKSG
jgi:hypothetical protein